LKCIELVSTERSYVDVVVLLHALNQMIKQKLEDIKRDNHMVVNRIFTDITMAERNSTKYKQLATKRHSENKSKTPLRWWWTRVFWSGKQPLLH